MKKPAIENFYLDSSRIELDHKRWDAANSKYAAFLAKKAKQNKAARARKTTKVAELKQIVAKANNVLPMTREEWLMRAVDLLRPIFAERGYVIPDNVKTTVGFPSAGGRGKNIGECHCSTMSAGGFHETFISPRLEDPTRVLGVLVHELGHATVGVKHGHRAPFKKFCLALCLEGKPTATTEGEAFRKMISPILAELGPFPHKALDLSGKKKQTTRMLKVECPCCGFTFRAARKSLIEIASKAETGHGELLYIHCPSPRCTETKEANGVKLNFKQATRIWLGLHDDREDDVGEGE